MNQRNMIIAAAALLALGVLVGALAGRGYEKSQSAKRADIAAQEARAESETLRQGAEEWAQSLAKAEGEAILRSFVAGLAPVVLAGRATSVEIAGASLLRLKGVQGVTILRADGKALYASDAKLTVSNAGSEQTRWAQTATDFIIREGSQPGITEMSLPVTDRGTVLAIVWLAHDSNLALERFRPAQYALAP